MANVMVQLQKLANENTAKTFAFNKEESAVARDWQTEMSNTSHQREVADLKAAGLNPVLSSGGSGAQAYSTQAASGVADSAVNAIGNYESAKTSAAATRAAAAQNAAAIRASAAAQAAAQRYAADMAYKTQKYHSDMAYKAQKYSIDNSKTGTMAGIVEKWTNRFFNSSKTKGLIQKSLQDISKTSMNQIFTNAKNAKPNNYILSTYGKARIRTALTKIGVTPTKYNQNLFISAIYFNNSSDQKRLAKAMKNGTYRNIYN